MGGAKFRPKDPGISRQNEVEQTETKQSEPSQVHTGHKGTEETGSKSNCSFTDSEGLRDCPPEILKLKWL